MHICVRENCKHISSDLKDQENRDMDFSSHLNYLRFSHYTFNYAARVSHSGKVTQSSNQWLMHKEAKVLQTAMTMLQMDLHECGLFKLQWPCCRCITHDCGHRHQNWQKLFWKRTANNKTSLLGFSHLKLSCYQVNSSISRILTACCLASYKIMPTEIHKAKAIKCCMVSGQVCLGPNQKDSTICLRTMLSKCLEVFLIKQNTISRRHLRMHSFKKNQLVVNSLISFQFSKELYWSSSCLHEASVIHEDYV